MPPRNRVIVDALGLAFLPAFPGRAVLPVEVWDDEPAYQKGMVVIDRGGWWLSTRKNRGSRPISGNANWTLVGGTPYVDVILDPVTLTTAPFVDAAFAGPGFVAIPDPGNGNLALLTAMLARVTPGDAWSGGMRIGFGYGSTAGLVTTSQITPDGFTGSQGAGNIPWLYNVVSTDQNPADTPTSGALVIFTGDVQTGGTRSVQLRCFYQIEPFDPASGTFFLITAVDQTGGAGVNTFTVSDAGTALSGATGTFAVVGSTGNNATYTIVSAVSGAGSTVITTVEAIPDATVDGLVRRP